MLSTPNCKINLGLHVVARRPDGYHDLETIFLPVHELHDILEIEPSDQFQFLQEGIAVDCALEDNICVNAYRLLQHDFPQVGAVRMRLVKQVPFGAGLGGGSSDAAFTLKMLNELFSLGLSTVQLQCYAARLGADCAFFIENRAAYATGIGDQLQLLDFDLETMGLHVEIRIPDDHVSTREAYQGIHPHPSPFDLRDAVRCPVGEWREKIVNDFEESVFPVHPAIRQLKEQLYAEGALYASMSGSGSAVFGLFHGSLN